MDTNMKTAGMKRLAVAAAALKKNGFDAEVFPEAAPAVKAVLTLIGKERRIGLGGSMTAAELGLPEALREAGNQIITHTPEMSDPERVRTWLKAQTSDFYIASPQAVTMRGEMIFVDALGNRAAAVLYGPGKVILLAGVNKLVPDTEEGLRRSRDIAALANNIRLGKDNPCVRSGKCEDCASPSRICNAALTLWKRPRLTDYRVILINERLGY